MKGSWLCLRLVLIYAVFVAVCGSYVPKLVVDLCSPDKVEMTLSGAADGGIIYIKGAGAVCKQETTSNSTMHEFYFDACAVDPYVMFHIIVQKNPLYQRGEDLQVPVLCLYEMDISVTSNHNLGNNNDDEMINKTVKPSVTMTLYRNGKDVSGSQIQLTDTLTMSIQLGVDYINDFDIKAKRCTADTILVVDEFCSPDVELFPSFASATQGVITTSFGAFRTTSLTGGAVEMVFSCSLQLCLGRCSAITCSNGNEAYGRRKRDVTSGNVLYDGISVGSRVQVGTPLESSNTEDEIGRICIHLAVLIISLLIVVALVSVITCTTIFTSNKKTTTHNEQSGVQQSNGLKINTHKLTTKNKMIDDKNLQSDDTCAKMEENGQYACTYSNENRQETHSVNNQNKDTTKREPSVTSDHTGQDVPGSRRSKHSIGFRGQI